MEDCDRMERRERDKLARQQIQSPTPEASLFPEPVRSEGDSSIELTLGEFSTLQKLFLEPKSSRFIGITTKPSPALLPPPSSQRLPQFGGGGSGSSVASSSSSSQFVPPPPQHPRNMPPSSSHHHHHPPPPSFGSQPPTQSSSQSSRNSSSGTYLKPDTKSTYNGRISGSGGYPIQPIGKHDAHGKSGSGSNLGPPSTSLMPNGRLSDKSGSVSGSSSSVGGGSGGGGSGRPIPNGRFQVPQVPKQHTKYPTDNADVQNIIDEMLKPTMYPRLGEIAATPRKEFENRFKFGQPNNHVYAELPPDFENRLQNKFTTTNVPKSTDLEKDLDLSESDEERKKQSSVDQTSPTNDNSSDSSDSGSSESESEESTGGTKGETANQTEKWNLSKYFLKPKNDTVPSPHDSNSQMHETNIKHEPNIVDDDHLSPSSSSQTYRHESNSFPMDIKKEAATQVHQNNCLELQPNQIKSEAFDKSPSSSSEKNQHFDAVESDHIESVIAEVKGLADLKPVSEIGTSSENEKKKVVAKPKKSPTKKPVKRRRKVPKEKKAADCDSSDEDEDFSSANTLSDRSRSIDKEKKGRGRPRKNPVTTPRATSKSPAVITTPVKNVTPNKREVVPKKAAVIAAAARRSSRANSMVKSREMLDTTTDSSSEDERPTKNPMKPSPQLSVAVKTPPATMPAAKSPERSRSLLKLQKHQQLQNKLNATTTTTAKAKRQSKSSDDDDDDDDDDDSSSSSNNSDDDRLSSSAERVSPRQRISPRRNPDSSSHSQHSTSSSSDDHSDSDSDVPREDKKIRDKTKSDENKTKTLRKLFVPSRGGEGGAKGKGQVLVVGQEQSNPAKDGPIHHEKILSPIAAFKHSSSNAAEANPTLLNHLKSPHMSEIISVSNNLSNSMTTTASASSAATIAAAATSLRTPERNLPTMNNIKHHSLSSTSSNSLNSSSNLNMISSPSSVFLTQNSRSIICKIELSRLKHVPKEWYQNSYTIRGGSSSSSSNNNNNTIVTSLSQSAEDDRLRSPRLLPKGTASSGTKLNHYSSSADSLLNSTSSSNYNNLNSNSLSNNNSRLVNSDSIVNQTAAASSPALRANVFVAGAADITPIGKTNQSENTGPNKVATNYPYGLVDNHCVRNPKDLSPKHEKPVHHSIKMVPISGSIKHEQIKSEFKNEGYVATLPIGYAIGSKAGIDNKSGIYGNAKLSKDSGVKQEQFIKNEYKTNSFVANDNQKQAAAMVVTTGDGPPGIGGGGDVVIGPPPPPMTVINVLSNNNDNKSTSSDEHIPKNRRKRSSSSSPYKDKRRKKCVSQLPNEVIEQLPPTNHDRLSDKCSPPPVVTVVTPVIQKVYKSYFERWSDNERFEGNPDFYLEQAKNLKHSADRETNQFKQVALYLKAVIYFILSAYAMEHCDRLPSAFTMYKDTLQMIKFISQKFNFHSMQGNDNTNKQAVLSLRCQSIIMLKLYQLKRAESKDAQKMINHYLNKGTSEVLNGNTPSISPSSVCSQGSGSNTPPLQMVPVQVHGAFQRQNFSFSYLSGAHDLWEQADNLVKKGNNCDFFINLDQLNGPLTLHSSIFEVFEYVQFGLQQLKEM